MNLKGLIYCRVSSAKQVKEGNGLSSQEKRCRDYAKNTLGIDCEKVFNDEGVSQRKSIQELLKYIDDNKNNNYTVIFEDLNRLSRDIQVHTLLRNEFRRRGVELACPNFQFEETPEGDFKENISVVVSQYERKKNKQRVIDRQKARLNQGFYCFPVPLGYKYIENKEGGGKLVVLDKNNNKIIKNVLEKYASSELHSICDVVRYLNKKGIKIGTIKNGKVYNTNPVSKILRNILYTGYLECEKMGIKRTKAKHQALISLKTYNKIQEKLNINDTKKFFIKNKIEINNNRIDKSNDFPLRGFLYCENSKKMFSGAWSQGKTKKIPYYTFPRNSPLKGKSINRNKLHTEFEEILKEIQPREDLIKFLEEAVELVRENNKKVKAENKVILKKKLKIIDNKIHKFIDRIGKTNSEILISNYENKIETLEEEKTIINRKINESLKNVGTPLKKKIKLVRDTLDIWKDGNLEKKKSLIENIFPEGIPINEKKHVGTPTFSLIYQSFSIGEKSFSQLVELEGIEPSS